MLQVEGKKMSKSLGNFFTVRDLLDQGVPGEVIRFVFLSTHYRKPMDWTEEKRREAEATLKKWRALTDGARAGGDIARVVETLADDLNTPEALTIMHHMARKGDAEGLLAAGALVGLLGDDLGDWSWRRYTLSDGVVQFIGDGDEAHGAVARAVGAKWKDLRAAKDYAAADALKAAALAAGLELRDMKTVVQAEMLSDFDPARLDALR
jgi:cysteinyl-tRNA synthetase